ncbi:hypothetical protein [Fulvivirga lutimaris]|uniref:hypothetical protein n=1 Tax=Fulvivirga lutimaris TaxID=1819566 RepID=UPI0012BB7320|nr:hypothetical protein [Fulvivirga lutimaris]MTI41230.1 hypothetical protein [Fulvivirga lutimaris]
MQRKKNIRLIIVLIVLVAVTIVTYFIQSNDTNTSIDKTLFVYQNTNEVDRVTIESQGAQVDLSFGNNQWTVNERYKADPQRISVLFAILKQVSVRRKVAKSQEEQITERFASQGVTVSLFEQGQQVKQFMVLGEEDKGLSYMTNSEADEKYLVEIPGYKSYLAGLFELDANGWRNPLVFDINWANLVSVQAEYIGKEANGFTIGFDNRDYGIAGMQTDSLKLTDYLDDVSLLYVNDYLADAEVETYNELASQPKAKITIKDVGRNNYSLTIFDKVQNGDYLVLIDSLDYALMQEGLINRVTKPKQYFRVNQRPQ